VQLGEQDTQDQARYQSAHPEQLDVPDNPVQAKHQEVALQVQLDEPAIQVHQIPDQQARLQLE
jgi:hypothetical protein